MITAIPTHEGTKWVFTNTLIDLAIYLFVFLITPTYLSVLYQKTYLCYCACLVLYVIHGTVYLISSMA